MRPPQSSLIRGLYIPTSSPNRVCPAVYCISAQSPPNVSRSLPNRRHPRLFFTSPYRPSPPPSSPPFSTDRGPTSREDTQTDFSAMNVLGNTPPPTTAIDACLSDGFHLDNGVKIGGGSGCLLIGGEAFSWRPWKASSTSTGDMAGIARPRMINAKGQWAVGENAWGVLDVVWPKPDLLILGLGLNTMPISPETRRYINSLGIRVDVQDTRNAAAQFNLLATERGVEAVAAALVPLGWREPKT